MEHKIFLQEENPKSSELYFGVALIVVAALCLATVPPQVLSGISTVYYLMTGIAFVLSFSIAGALLYDYYVESKPNRYKTHLSGTPKLADQLKELSASSDVEHGVYILALIPRPEANERFLKQIAQDIRDGFTLPEIAGLDVQLVPMLYKGVQTDEKAVLVAFVAPAYYDEAYVGRQLMGFADQYNPYDKPFWARVDSTMLVTLYYAKETPKDE